MMHLSHMTDIGRSDDMLSMTTPDVWKACGTGAADAIGSPAPSTKARKNNRARKPRQLRITLDYRLGAVKEAIPAKERALMSAFVVGSAASGPIGGRVG